MKTPLSNDGPPRFNAPIRHYHRSSGGTNRTWDEWIDGKPRTPGSGKWLKFVGILIAFIALAGIIAGLIIELR